MLGTRGVWLALVAAGLVAAPVAAEHHEAGHAVVEMLSANVQGKNVFIPSTVVVAEGAPHVLSVFNTTDTPHGFKIPELGIETLLPAGEEHRVELPALEGDRIYRIECHLHPPHRSAQLVVLDGDD
jgi:hypothetical protein